MKLPTLRMVVAIALSAQLVLVTAHAAGSRHAAAAQAPHAPGSGTYVALGDSYSSGEGNPPYQGASDGNGCHRSALSYPFRVNLDLGFYNPRFSFHACSGAHVSAFTSSFKGERKQLSWVDRNSTQLVTLTIGGNNAHFKEVIESCLSDSAPANFFIFASAEPGCKRRWAARVDSAIASMGNPRSSDSLAGLYQTIASAAPRAQVVVVGYPRFFPAAPPTKCLTGALNTHFPKATMTWINAEIASMDGTIQRAAAAAHVTYVDAYNAFSGHERCTNDPYLNGAIVSRHREIRAGSFHPNHAGHVALARLVDRAVVAPGGGGAGGGGVAGGGGAGNPPPGNPPPGNASITASQGGQFGCSTCSALNIQVHDFPTGTYTYECHDNSGPSGADTVFFSHPVTVTDPNQGTWPGVFCYDSPPYTAYLVMAGVRSNAVTFSGGAPPPPPPPSTYAETTGGVTHTWTNYSNAGGTEGAVIPSNATVQVACKVMGFKVADGDTWWYRIASSPWSGAYYASADAFYNNGQTSGSLHGTPFVDPTVGDC